MYTQKSICIDNPKQIFASTAYPNAIDTATSPLYTALSVNKCRYLNVKHCPCIMRANGVRGERLCGNYYKRSTEREKKKAG